MSKQDLFIVMKCLSQDVQSPETMLSNLATFPDIHIVGDILNSVFKFLVMTRTFAQEIRLLKAHFNFPQMLKGGYQY